MIRIMFGLFLLCLAILVAALRYLPWWGFLLTLGGVFLGLMAAANLLAGQMGVMLFSIPFRLKGAALQRAKADVNAVEAVSPSWPGEGGKVDAALDSYTIAPRRSPGPFKFREPGELGLLPAKLRVIGMDRFPDRVGVSGVEVFQNGRFEPDEGMKYFGPQRLRLRVQAKRGTERRQQFLYYFEAFGAVTLPPPAKAAKGREATVGREAESTRS